jgi:hypothetical protein
MSSPRSWRVWLSRATLPALLQALALGVGFQQGWLSSADAAIPSGLVRLLESPAGRYLVFESAAGRDLLERSFGEAASAVRGNRDLTQVIARLDEAEMQAVSRRLERGMLDIEARYRAQAEALGLDRDAAFGAGNPRARVTGLGARERELLARIAGDELRIAESFFPSRTFGTYSAQRQAFARGIELDYALGRRILRFPQGMLPLSNPDGHLQFGFESEYTLEEAGRLLQAYAPVPELGVSRTQWSHMQPEEKVAWVRAHLREVFPHDRLPGKLFKIAQSSEFSFLPDRLILDSTGNIEVVLAPADTLEEWIRRVMAMESRFGAGSMQGTVSLPNEAFHGQATGLAPEAAVRENLGYLGVMSDLDTLSKLESGAIRFQTNPSSEVAASFNHPFLGPFSRSRQEMLGKYLRANAEGRLLDQGALSQIGGSDASFKYYGGTAYRPDIVEGRVVLEVRDAHKSVATLVDRLTRTTFFLQFGRSQFAAAAELQAFDPVRDFARLPAPLQRMLQQLFPSKALPGVSYSAKELRALEVYRNFAYPMRDWSEQLRFLAQTRTVAPEVAAAQASYLRKLEEIAADLTAGRITERVAKVRVEGALAQFAPESGLGNAYRRWLMRNLSSDPSWGRYLNVAARELGPLRDAYPTSVWEGSLESRMQRFLVRWSENVALVDDVKFGFTPATPGAAPVQSSRKVLLISTQGLSEANLAALTQDYTEAFARGTVSFPLGEAGGHLHTRLGTQDFDYYGWFNQNPYRAPSRKRLEAFVALSPEEELRLRFYFEQARTNTQRVVGPANYNGVPDGRTNGTLRDNRPVDPGVGHNCTSWVCTSRIGGQQERLVELTGATVGLEVHTNPGWWSNYLTGGAPAGRIPFVAHWNAESSLSSLKAQVRSGQEFPAWNFDLH